MQFRKTLLLFAFTPLLSLVSCGNKDDGAIVSYYLEANTTNVKLEYNVGEKFDPTGLIVNEVKLVNGKVTKATAITNYTFSIDLDKGLTKEDKEVFVYSPKDDVMPGSFTITVTNPTFNIGEQQNLEELYDGYTFTSSNNFIGRVRPDGILETYREGTFELVGTKAGAPGIYLSCIVDTPDENDYKNFDVGGSISGFLIDLNMDASLLVDTSYAIRYSVTKHPKATYRYEVTNPEAGEIVFDSYGIPSLKTSTKPCDSRLKIYYTDNGEENLALDYYFRVNTPYDIHEISSFLTGTQWVVPAALGLNMALNFTDNGSCTLGGYKSKNMDFTFTLADDPIYNVGETKLCTFICKNDDPYTKIERLEINLTGGFINLHDQSGLICVFKVSN